MTAIRTFRSEASAFSWARAYNAIREMRGRRDFFVVVDGPCDGEFSVMELRDAIDGDFSYRWSVQ